MGSNKSRRGNRRAAWLFPLGFAVWAVACGTFDNDQPEPALAGRDNSANGSGGSTAAAGSGNGGGLPPEQELEDSFKAPGVSGTRIFSINPSSGRVAIIDTETLEVHLTNAGFTPMQVVALPKAGDLDRALVLNAGSSDATYLEVDQDWNISTRAVATHSEANSVSVSTDGQWAIIWTDYRKLQPVDPTDGFQDITVVDLATGEPTRLTVGFRPVVIAMSNERQVAYVSAEPGIDVIDLQGDRPQVSHSIAFSAGADVAVVSQDVRFTTEATYAFIRYQDRAELSVLSLEDELWTVVPMNGIVTDLDLSEDGSTAVAIVRSPEPVLNSVDAGVSVEAGLPVELPGDLPDAASFEADGGDAGDAAPLAAPGPVNSDDSGAPPVEPPAPDYDAGLAPQPGSEVAVFRLGSTVPLSNPQVIRIPQELFGSVSVSTDGNTLVLYTNAVETDRVTVLHLEDGSYRTVTVKSPVQAIMITQDAQHAVSFQSPATGDPEVSSKKGAFSLIPLQVERAPKIVATDAPLVSLGLIEGSDSYAGLVTTSDPATSTFVSYWVGFPDLTADLIRLASEPLATGVVTEAELGFIAQRHPEGRLTLVDLQSGVPRTLTGFELAAKVVDR